MRRIKLHPEVRACFVAAVAWNLRDALMLTTDLLDEEIADMLGWLPDDVRRIRTIYVDDHARNVALARRIERRSVNQTRERTQSNADVLILRV